MLHKWSNFLQLVGCLHRIVTKMKVPLDLLKAVQGHDIGNLGYAKLTRPVVPGERQSYQLHIQTDANELLDVCCSDP